MPLICFVCLTWRGSMISRMITVKTIMAKPNWLNRMLYSTTSAFRIGLTSMASNQATKLLLLWREPPIYLPALSLHVYPSQGPPLMSTHHTSTRRSTPTSRNRPFRCLHTTPLPVAPRLPLAIALFGVYTPHLYPSLHAYLSQSPFSVSTHHTSTHRSTFTPRTVPSSTPTNSIDPCLVRGAFT